MKESGISFRHIFTDFEPAFISGLILCDPERLDQYCSSESRESDLIARFDTKDEWQDICRQGIMVCAFDIEPGYTVVVVRHENAEAYLTNTPRTLSGGWLLGAETGNVVLANLNTLMFWDPWGTHNEDDSWNKYEWFAVGPGWYKVELQSGIRSEESDEEEWVIEFVLIPVKDRPSFTAELREGDSQLDQVSGRSEMILRSPSSAQDAGIGLEEQADRDLLLAMLSRLNTNAFEAFVVELFNDQRESFLRLDDVGDGIFRQSLVDSYGGSLESVYTLHYLPEALRDPSRLDVSEDPSLVRRLGKVRDYYRGKCGYYGMVSPDLARAAKLRALAILTNLGGIDEARYQSHLIPRYHQLAQSLDLYVSEFYVGSYDSFLDLNASGAKEAFQRFLTNNSEGISIRLNETDAHVTRFAYETSLGGVSERRRYFLEPVFTSCRREQERTLAEFEALIRSETAEAVLEEFLVTHFREIFGSNYDRIETQIWLKFPDLDIADKSRRLDVFLRNSVISDWELFEVKRVVPLTRTYRDTPVIAREVSYAVQQVKNYARILSQESVRRRFAQEGIEYYEPSLHLVVGKTPQIPHSQWRWLVSSHDKEVKILTFDDLLGQMRRRAEDRSAFLQSLMRD
jgi:hypothetical protein